MAFLETVGILDLIFSGILIISILVGLIRGAIREVLSLIGLAVAIYLAFTFSEMISDRYVSRFFEEPKISYLVSFVLIILAAIFAIALINMFFSQLLRASGLSFVNRFFGLLFGAIRGAVICSVIVLALSFIPSVTGKAWWKASAMVPVFQSMTKITLKYLPDNVANYLGTTEKQVKQTIQQVSGDLNQGQNTDSLSEKMQEIQQTAETTQRILQSISDSDKDTKTPVIQLESTTENTEVGTPQKTESDKVKLTLESYN